MFFLIPKLREEFLSTYHQLKNLCSKLKQHKEEQQKKKFKKKRRRHSSDSMMATSCSSSSSGCSSSESGEYVYSSSKVNGLLNNVLSELKELLADLLEAGSKMSSSSSTRCSKCQKELPEGRFDHNNPGAALGTAPGAEDQFESMLLQMKQSETLLKKREEELKEMQSKVNESREFLNETFFARRSKQNL